jgi:hypothetical protein
LNLVVHDAIYSNGLPAPNQQNYKPIYVVVTPNGVMSAEEPQDIGYHTAFFTNYNPFDTENAAYAWVGNNPSGNLDTLTPTLGHEIIEATSDPDLWPWDAWRVKPGASWSGGGDNEICDQEAQNYTARVNGVLVQSYWSQVDGAYLIGGGAEQLTVTNKKLIIDGDQLWNSKNDKITVDTDTTQDIVITLNGEQYTIPQSELTSIEIDGGSGLDQINVNALPSTIPLTINVGTGIDSVNVLSATPNSYDVNGTITINKQSGLYNLTFDDQGGFGKIPYNVDAGSVSNSFLTINDAGVSSLWLDGEQGGDIFTINNTPAGSVTWIKGGFGNDELSIAASGGPINFDGVLGNDQATVGLESVADINGQVKLNQGAGNLAVTVDNLWGPAGTFTMDTQGNTGLGRITGLGNWPILYQYTPSGSIKVYPATLGLSAANVLQTGEETQIVFNQTVSNVNIGDQHQLSGILGHLTVLGTTGKITLDDSGDTSLAKSVSLVHYAVAGQNSVGRILGFAPSAIDYADTSASWLTLDTGTIGSIFYAYQLGVPTTFYDGGPDGINLGGAAGAGMAGVKGSVYVFSKTNGTLVSLDDSAKQTPDIVSIGTLNGFIPSERVSGMTSSPVYISGGVAGVNVTTGKANDTVLVLGTLYPTVVNGGGGNDKVAIGNAGLTSGIGADLTVMDTNGKASVYLDDSADAVNEVVTASTVAGFVGPTTSIVGLASGKINTLDSTTASESIKLGAGSDSVLLQNLKGKVPLSLAGGSGNNILFGPSTAPRFMLTGVNSGKIVAQNILWTGMSSLSSTGSGNVFTLMPAGSVTGTLDGGPVGNGVLDYSQRTTPVSVNLATGTATSTGGVAHMRVVLGSAGADTLTGDGKNDILVGGAGNDLIHGGGGNDLIIGGKGTDRLYGDGGNCLLIGGSTPYDHTLAALEAIEAEWSRTDVGFTGRIADIQNGTGYAAGHPLRFNMLLDDAAADIVDGTGGLDWFLGVYSTDVLVGKTTTDRVN